MKPPLAFFRSGERIRSRTISPVVLHGVLDIPEPPARLSADWDKAVDELHLEVGDIDTLPLARTILRWPDYARCAEAVTGWMQTQDLPDMLDPNDLALMVCRGVHYHHDAEQYAHAAFCNLFLTEDKGLDLHFAVPDLHIPLRRGTVVIFDTAQPHAVIPRGSSAFNVADFATNQDCTQVFLTWELLLENAQLKRTLQIEFDIDVSDRSELHEQKLCLNGAPLDVCPDSGRWHPEG